MTHVRIVIDSDIIFDGSLDTWQATPPDYFRDLIRPDAKPAPWLKAIMIVIAEAAATGQSVNIEAVTSAHRWAMEVSTIWE